MTLRACFKRDFLVLFTSKQSRHMLMKPKSPILKQALSSLQIGLVFAFLGISTLSACTKNQTETSGNPPTAATLSSADRGRTIYQTQCTACHNRDPKKPGSIGPEVFGSSRELLEARIMKAEYPPQYQPKRNTHSMAALPHLKNEIDSLHSYLNSNP